MHKDVHKEAPAAENPGLEDLNPRRPPLSYPKSFIIDRVHEAKEPSSKGRKSGCSRQPQKMQTTFCARRPKLQGPNMHKKTRKCRFEPRMLVKPICRNLLNENPTRTTDRLLSVLTAGPWKKEKKESNEVIAVSQNETEERQGDEAVVIGIVAGRIEKGGQ